MRTAIPLAPKILEATRCEPAYPTSALLIAVPHPSVTRLQCPSCSRNRRSQVHRSSRPDPRRLGRPSSCSCPVILVQHPSLRLLKEAYILRICLVPPWAACPQRLESTLAIARRTDRWLRRLNEADIRVFLEKHPFRCSSYGKELRPAVDVLIELWELRCSSYGPATDASAIARCCFRGNVIFADVGRRCGIKAVNACTNARERNRQKSFARREVECAAITGRMQCRIFAALGAYRVDDKLHIELKSSRRLDLPSTTACQEPARDQ
jgi:hypothetical protein